MLETDNVQNITIKSVHQGTEALEEYCGGCFSGGGAESSFPGRYTEGEEKVPARGGCTKLKPR